MFQLITSDKLVVGTKYGVKFKGDDYSGVYKGPVTICGRNYLCFDHIYDRNEKEHLPNPFYFTNQIYYEFISQQPQWNMERRAVTMIVRRLLGDDCFEW